MQWIIFGGIILYYLYSAFQTEQKKNATQNKNLNNFPKDTDSQMDKPKTFQDILKEIEDAMEGKTLQKPIEVNKPYKNLEKKKTVIYEPKLDDYQDNYKYDYVDNYVSLQDKIDSIKNLEGDEGGKRIAHVNVEDYNPLKKDKKPKFINLNGKQLSPRDLFLAHMILEKKV